jgi:mannosyltransferase OCH1-like enzyme
MEGILFKIFLFKMNYSSILLILLILFFVDYLVHIIGKSTISEKFPPRILSLSSEEVELPTPPRSNTIPKILHRTYIDEKEALKFKKALDKSLETNNYLQHIFYSNEDVENFIKTNYSERVFKAYMKINPQYGPARADFFRYLVVYLKGGLYLDVKSFLLENIEVLFEEDKLLISKGRSFSLCPNNFGIIPSLLNRYNWSDFSKNKYGEYNNWHFLSPPGNKILKETIRQIVLNTENGNKYNYGEYSVLALTGPILFTRVVDKYYDKNAVKIFEKNLGNTVSYTLFDHRTKNKKHYSKLENKNVLL